MLFASSSKMCWATTLDKILSESKMLWLWLVLNMSAVEKCTFWIAVFLKLKLSSVCEWTFSSNSMVFFFFMNFWLFLRWSSWLMPGEWTQTLSFLDEKSLHQLVPWRKTVGSDLCNFCHTQIFKVCFLAHACKTNQHSFFVGFSQNISHKWVFCWACFQQWQWVNNKVRSSEERNLKSITCWGSQKPRPVSTEGSAGKWSTLVPNGWLPGSEWNCLQSLWIVCFVLKWINRDVQVFALNHARETMELVHDGFVWWCVVVWAMVDECQLVLITVSNVKNIATFGVFWVADLSVTNSRQSHLNWLLWPLRIKIPKQASQLSCSATTTTGALRTAWSSNLKPAAKPWLVCAPCHQIFQCKHDNWHCQ